MTKEISRIEALIEEALAVTELPARSPSGTSVEPGDVLDDTYRIVRLIGQGGMGSVYEATDVTLERRVAIKVIRREYSSRPEFLERFRREAVAMAKVDNYNVVRIHHCEVKSDGPSYIVMEYVEGETLADLIARVGRLSYGNADDICQQILRALYAIHRVGIIHRDLKPGNVMLTKSSKGYRVRICDFGLGKMLETTDAGNARMDLTEVGVMLGTPKYMSPEQCRGLRVCEPTDIYAAGVILFEMLSGRPPFCGSDNNSTVMRQLNMPPPMDRLGGNVPKEAQHLIAKSLAKSVDRRYPNALAMLRALNAAKVARRQRKRFPLSVLTVSLILLVVIGSVAYLALGIGTSRASQEAVSRKESSAVAVGSAERDARIVTQPIVVNRPLKQEEPKTSVAEPSSSEEPIAKDWPLDPGKLLSLAQTYGDGGDRESRSEALRRFLGACRSRGGSACSRANLTFARGRLASR